MQEIEESFASLIEQKRLKFINELPKNLIIKGDRFLITQAISNIISNAIDFSNIDGKLTITAQKLAHSIELRIHNVGAEIPDYALPRLYERFYSLPRPDSGEKSTGLGLNFVKEIIALHKGNVMIKNEDNGVAVTIIIPKYKDAKN